jgi:hypothetical protein
LPTTTAVSEFKSSEIFAIIIPEGAFKFKRVVSESSVESFF